MAQLIRTLTGQSTKSFNEPVAPSLARMTTTDAQTGNLNHLSAVQGQKLDEFKSLLEKEGWWSSDGVNGKPTHDDGTLLRYLRARKFDVQGAYGQFTDTEKWMKEQRVEELYEHFDVDLFEKTRRMYPAWTGHRDKRGIPIYVYEIKSLDSKAISSYEKETTAYKSSLPNHQNLSTPAKNLPLFALYHNLLNFVLPLCSSLERPNPEIPVTNSTNIVDISGVSLRQFWNLKAHMQEASVLATAHYPETLDRIFIIGAPSFFPTVWGWIKRWFDPVTVSKIFILSKPEVRPTLENFMSPKDIPEKYGGSLKWAWGDDPDLDSETRQALERDGQKGWVKGPALWLDQKRIVVGSANGKLRRSDAEVAAMKPIMYAADYTEEPVHQEKRKESTASSHRKSLVERRKDSQEKPANGANGISEEPNNLAGAVSSATVVPAGAVSSEEPGTRLPPSQQSIPNHIPQDTVRLSPMGDANVHLPNMQAASPATTAEYISPSSTPKQARKEVLSEPPTNGSTTTPLPPPAVLVAPVAREPQREEAVSIKSVDSAPHPPGHTAPGALPHHTVQMNLKIAEQLAGESTVVIPASADASLPHPEVVVASDRSKGLAMEADKLELLNAHPDSRQRPVAERFVTASQF